MPKVVLAYSGGLDTSVAIRWMKEHYGMEVYAVAIDVGEERDYPGIRQKALDLGAVGAEVIDAKEEFARDFIFPALKANALYEDQYPLSTSLARPLIAKHVGEVALREKAEAVAHGATGKGNDQVRPARSRILGSSRRRTSTNGPRTPTPLPTSRYMSRSDSRKARPSP